MKLDEFVKDLQETAKRFPKEQEARIIELAQEIQRLDSDNRYKLIPSYLLDLIERMKRLDDLLKRLADQYDSLLRVSFIPPSELREARVRIYDWKGNDRRWPRAVVENPDPESTALRYVPYQSIDIIKTIKNNPTSIRHPAILLAVHRWQQIIHYHHSLPSRKKKKVEVKAVGGDSYERAASPRTLTCKIAEDHLKHAGEALLEGAREQILPKETALGNFIRWNGLLGRMKEYLHIAWELLTDPEIKKKCRQSEKLAILQERLRAEGKKHNLLSRSLPDDLSTPALDFEEIYIEQVIHFLNSEKGRSFLTNRKNWVTIKAAFESWYLFLDKSTLRKYRSQEKAQSTSVKLNARFLDITDPWSAIFNLSEILDWSSLHSWFSPPVILTDISS